MKFYRICARKLIFRTQGDTDKAKFRCTADSFLKSIAIVLLFEFNSDYNNNTFDIFRIKPNLKSVVLCNGLKNATEAVWNKTYKKYLNSKDSSEKAIILAGLGCSRNETILKNYLNLVVDRKSQINSTLTAFKTVYTSSAIGFNVTLDFIIKKSHAILIQ